MRKAKSWAESNSTRILVIHVIDQDFVKQCLDQRLGTEGEIKRKLFFSSKSKLRKMLREEGMEDRNDQIIVCEGIPCMEINRRAVENDVEMIIMGSKGNSDDLRTIFFGSTTEKVLRFIKRPVLCIPPENGQKVRETEYHRPIRGPICRTMMET